MSILPGWWHKHFLSVELALSFLIAIAFAIWIKFLGGLAPVVSALGSSRGDLYGAFAAIFGSLLGFVIAAVSIVLGSAESDKLQIVRDSEYYDHLWDTFKAAIRALALATIAALGGLVLDRGREPLLLVMIANVFSISLAALRLWRVIWVLENIVSLIIKPADAGRN